MYNVYIVTIKFEDYHWNHDIAYIGTFAPASPQKRWLRCTKPITLLPVKGTHVLEFEKTQVRVGFFLFIFAHNTYHYILRIIIQTYIV